MPPPYDSPAFHLRLLPTPYTVTQLAPSEPLPQEYIDALTGPSSAFAGDGKLRMLSVTRTSEEISIVQEGLGEEGEWRCVRIAGPMAFDVVGVVNNVTAPIKAAGVGVFVVSTWDTDYVLIPREHIDKAVEVWKADGWRFTE
ncbi:ACT domain-containing protein [Irpex lacteus]|nr:ACT domain-containing protein [Irpex lacteus]